MVARRRGVRRRRAAVSRRKITIRGRVTNYRKGRGTIKGTLVSRRRRRR